MSDDPDRPATLILRAPYMGESVEQVYVVAWRKRPGDAVVEGEVLYEIETDKVSMEVTAPADGVLEAVDVGDGGDAAVGAPVGLLRVQDGAEPEPEPPPLEVPAPPRRRVVVLGGGLGGYAYALRSAALGAQVALVEPDEVGGYEAREGLFVRRAWLAAAERFADARSTRPADGVHLTARVELAELRAHAEAEAGTLQRAMRVTLGMAGVEVVRGRGALSGGSAVRVEPVDGAAPFDLDADRVATAWGGPHGAREGLAPDGDRIVAVGRGATSFPEVPRRLAVIGGSAEAVEWAGVWHHLGAEVTWYETEPPVVGALAAAWHHHLRKAGVAVVSGPAPTARRVGDEVEVTLGDDARRFDRVVVAPKPPSADARALGAAGGHVAPELAVAHAWGLAHLHAGEDAPVPPTVRVLRGPVELAWVGRVGREGDGGDRATTIDRMAHPGSRLRGARGAATLIVHGGSGRVLGLWAVGPGAAEVAAAAGQALMLGATYRELGAIPGDPYTHVHLVGALARASREPGARRWTWGWL